MALFGIRNKLKSFIKDTLQLNEEEVLDLLAYTLSKGNKRDGRFRKKK